jgi:hypothetical protein
MVAELRVKDSPWDDVKDYGDRAFKKQAGAAAQRLLAALDTIGVVSVRVGELEGFAPNINVAKGPAWLPAALAAGAHKSPEAQKHIETIARNHKTGEAGPTPS